LGGASPHRATPDAIVTAHIFRELFYIFQEGFIKQTGREPWTEDLIRFNDAPIFIRKMPFGKYKDLPMENVPSDYLQWALRTMTDMSADLRSSMTKVLNDRRPQSQKVIPHGT
jgi:exodeoxyribonuclease X